MVFSDVDVDSPSVCGLVCNEEKLLQALPASPSAALYPASPHPHQAHRSPTVCVSHSGMSDSLHLWTVAHELLCPWNSPGKNSGVGSHSLLQGLFLIQGSNPGLLSVGRFFNIWATREAQLGLFKRSTLCSQRAFICEPLYFSARSFPLLHMVNPQMSQHKCHLLNELVSDPLVYSSGHPTTWSSLSHHSGYLLHSTAGGRGQGNGRDDEKHGWHSTGLGKILQGLQSRQRHSNGIMGSNWRQMEEFWAGSHSIVDRR